MISFIVPVYNKGPVLYRMLSSLMKRLKNSPYINYEIIVVNDGSTDNSFAEALRFKKFNGETEKIKLFHYTKNVGKGFALRFGFSKSTGSTVCFLDGDLDISSGQVLQTLDTFFSKNSSMVIASKYHRASRTYYPFSRYLYSIVLKGAIKLLFNLTISDTQVGLKVFRRDVLEMILPRLIIKRFATDLELLVVAHMYGYRDILETPVVIKQIDTDISTVNIVEVKNFCQDIAAIFYRKNILGYYDSKQLEHTTNSALYVRSV